MKKTLHAENKCHKLLCVCLLLTLSLGLVGNFNILGVQAQGSYIFGDGFESGDYSAWNGAVTRGGNALNVVTEQAHNGSRSSKSVYSGGLWAESEKFGLGTNNFLYARGYFRIASGFTLGAAGRRFEVLMVVMTPPGADYGGAERGRALIYYDGTDLYWRFIATFGSGSWETGYLQVVNVDQWYCIEVYYMRSAATEEAKMWIDGELKSTLTGMSPSAETINQIFVGFHNINLAAEDSVTIFYDDVIADDEYIGPTTEVSNTPPVASGLTITPSSPYTTEDLVGSYTYSDADGDPENGTEIRWYKDGVLQPLYNDTLIVSSSSTEPGQVWYFTVRPKDGKDFGTLQASPNVTIRTPSPYIFSDGFETGDFSAWDGTAAGFGDSVSVVSEDSYDGSYSVKSVISSKGHAYSYKGFTDQTTVYVHWYFKFTADLPDAPGEKVWLSVLLGDNGATEICRVGVEYFDGRARISLYNVGASTYYGSTTLSPNTWYSLEYKFYRSSNGEFGVWLNGVQERSVSLNLLSKPYADQVRIGVAHYTGVSPIVFSDGVVVAETRIGA